MIIVSGSSHTSLSKKIASQLGNQVVQINTRTFPDGELHICLPIETPMLENQHIVYIQSAYPNRCILEMLFTLDLLNEYNPRRLDLVIPYMGYARQDKRFLEGEAITSQTLGKLIRKLGVTKISFFDVHFFRNIGEFNFQGTLAENITVFPLLIAYLKEKFNINQPYLLSPDIGATKLVEKASQGQLFSYLKKQRLNSWNVKFASFEESLKGREIIILDDIISTGGTIIKAVKLCKKNKAKRIFVGATHGLFLSDSLQKLSQIVDGLTVSDTIVTSVSHVSIKNLIVNRYKKTID
jgi:ribose-phosphate pyrophosphokinase